MRVTNMITNLNVKFHNAQVSVLETNERMATNIACVCVTDRN